MEFMGYRSMVAKDQIEEFLDAARCGEMEISIDGRNLTDSEAEYL